MEFRLAHLKAEGRNVGRAPDSVGGASRQANVVQRVANLIRDNGGEILHSDEWGTRRLSFPIRKKRNGYYVNLYFSAPPEGIVRLERNMEIDDDILRYMTLVMDAKMLRHFERQKADGGTTRALERAGARGGAASEEDDED